VVGPVSMHPQFGSPFGYAEYGRGEPSMASPPAPELMQALLRQKQHQQERKEAVRAANRRSATTSRARKRAVQEEMEAHNQILRRRTQVLALLPDLILAVDAEGRITYSSEACKGLLGAESYEMVDASVTTVVAPECRESLRLLLGEKLGSAGSLAAHAPHPCSSSRMCFLRRDGSRVWCEMNVGVRMSPVSSSSGGSCSSDEDAASESKSVASSGVCVPTELVMSLRQVGGSDVMRVSCGVMSLVDTRAGADTKGEKPAGSSSGSSSSSCDGEDEHSDGSTYSAGSGYSCSSQRKRKVENREHQEHHKKHKAGGGSSCGSDNNSTGASNSGHSTTEDNRSSHVGGGRSGGGGAALLSPSEVEEKRRCRGAPVTGTDSTSGGDSETS